MDLSPLHERLLEVFGDKSFRAIGEATDTNSETVRRYMQGQAPSAEFLAAVCVAAGINGQWLLTGRGPKKSEHIKPHALKEASAAELLNAMARTLERLSERVERLELFVLTMETRIRTMRSPATARQDQLAELKADLSSQSDHPHDQVSPPRSLHSSIAPQSSSDSASRARSIADALTQRPYQADR